MEFDNIQSNFTAGEVSPKLWGRVELEKYLAGLAIVENMIVQPHGGVIRRGGFHYITEVKDSSKVTRVVEFNYKNTYAYILEFGENYIRVYVNREQVLDGAVAYEIVTTYIEAEILDLRFEQDTDTLYITHKDHPPAKLTRAAHDNWTLANISFTFDAGHAWTANDYPALNWFYEQRHFFAATPSKLNGVWASKSALYTDMRLGTGLDNEGLEFIVKMVYKFLWASAGQEINLGGSNAEFKLASNALNEAITPSNIRPTLSTNYGSIFASPVRIDDSVVFVQKGGRKFRRFAADYQSGSYSDSYKASDITILSSHIATSGILNLVYSTVPDSIIWACRVDGVLIGITYEPDHKVFGWHRHIVGGTDVKVKSLAVAKAVEGVTQDELWAVIERTIDGSTVQYIEYMIDGLSEEQSIEDAFFVDSGITKTGSAFTLVDELDHLEGEEVQILGDGAVQAPKTVSGGEITLDQAVDKVHVGLQYISVMETLPIEGGNPLGTSQGHLKRIKNVSLRLDRSIGFSLGDVYGNLDQYYFGPSVMNEPLILFTGDTEPMPFTGSYDRQSRLKIMQDAPLPFNLLAIMYQAKMK